MSFRGRLRLFFALIVIVPLIALGVVLFALPERIETGKAEAGIAAGTRTAIGIYQEEARRAGSRVTEVARDPALGRAVARGDMAAAGRPPPARPPPGPG